MQRLNATTRAQWVNRLHAIESPAQRRWGELDPPALMAHLRRTLEISLGEVPVKDISNPLTKTIVRWIFFDLPTPWPKGKIKAPRSFFEPPSGDLAAERERLLGAVDRFIGALEADPDRRELSPLLGPIPLRYWAKVHGRHFEHHLRQYGA